jgi:hypothetical protein
MEQIVYRIKVPLEKQDDEFIQIQDLIEAKRNFLLEKQKKMRVLSKQNIFLEEVQRDYNKYYNYIAKQKEDQIYALELLKNYIQDLTQSGNLTKNNIQDAKEEQKKILGEIQNVRNGLDDLIKDTDYINLSLQKKSKINSNLI